MQLVADNTIHTFLMSCGKQRYLNGTGILGAARVEVRMRLSSLLAARVQGGDASNGHARMTDAGRLHSQRLAHDGAAVSEQLEL
jgi:hypothetical protein